MRSDTLDSTLWPATGVLKPICILLVLLTTFLGHNSVFLINTKNIVTVTSQKKLIFFLNMLRLTTFTHLRSTLMHSGLPISQLTMTLTLAQVTTVIKTK